MDYDPSLQYRERHNASWDRIRHENASSVRSEPYLPQNYQFNFEQELNNYAPPDHQLLREYPSSNQQTVEQPNPNIQEELRNLEEDDEFEEDTDDEVVQSEDEVDCPDIYCLECDSKLEDTSRHDVTVCASRRKLTKFQCILCQRGFNVEKNIKIHKIIEHSSSASFSPGTVCQFCTNDQVSFSRYSAYMGHLKLHQKSDFLHCEHCGEEFELERDLDRHMRREHSEDPYELLFCPKCKKVVTFEESKSHQLLHSAQDSVIARTSHNQKPLPTLMKPPIGKRKQKTVVRERKFQCTECSKSFVRPSELARHSMVHMRAQVSLPKWKCAICEKEYAHHAGLLEHKRVAHGNAKKVVCRVCGMEFTKKSNHDRHMSKIHPIEPDTSKAKFECPDCPSVHNTLGALTRHKRLCHNVTSLKPTKNVPVYERHLCNICNREFRDQKMLKTHKKMHLMLEHKWRNSNGERKCDYCDKSFVLRASLIWHMQKHFEEQPTDEPTDTFCAICDLNFYSNLEYRQHLEEQHTVVCGVCQQRFASRQVYEDHICNRKFARGMLNHQASTSNKVLVCRLCRPPLRFATLRQYKEHRMRHLPRKTHLCWTCHKSFRTAQLLSLHAEVHDRQPVQCSHCPQVFHSRVALKQHIRLTHGGDTNYQCVVHVDRTLAMSAQSFAEYGLAPDHSQQTHRARSVTEWMEPQQQEEQIVQESRHQDLTLAASSTSQTRAVEQQHIRCEICKHLYDNIELLCDHWQTSDADTDHSYGFVTCPLCDLRIRGAPDAANHLRSVHLFARPKVFSFMKPPSPSPFPPPTSKKTHQCIHCSKVFGRKNDLDRHVRIHTGEKEHECPQCHAFFRVKSTLKTHMATHSDNPPQFQCTVCQKAFFERKTLVVHMRIHTGEQPFKCRFCDQHFRTSSMMRTHEKKCGYTVTSTSSAFQPQFITPQTDIDRTITQISTLSERPLQLSRHSAFNTVQSLGGMGPENPIYVITKPINIAEYVVIVHKTKPPEGSMRYAVDTVSEIKINQLHESTNLSIVLHNEMRLNLNTVKMLQLLPSLQLHEPYKTRVTVGQPEEYVDSQELFTIIAHNKTSGASFIRRCDICEVDLPTKMISDAHFYSEDHETAQLMYPSIALQQPISADRRIELQATNNGDASEFACKLCGSQFFNLDNLLDHIRRQHDEPVAPPRPAAHTAPIN